METADLAFVNCSADDHGTENCFIQDSGIDRSALHQVLWSRYGTLNRTLRSVLGLILASVSSRQGIR